MLLNWTTAIIRVYMPVRKPNYWPKACPTPVRSVALYPFQLVVTKPPPADLFTSPATTNSASAFEKDGVRRARRSYGFVHFLCYVHDNPTNKIHTGAHVCGDFGGKTPHRMVQVGAMQTTNLLLNFGASLLHRRSQRTCWMRSEAKTCGREWF